MARHDFRCPVCQQVFPDVTVPISIGARGTALFCPACREPWPQLEPIPAFNLSLFSDAEKGHGRSCFEKTTIPVEAPGTPSGWRAETIGSLADLRRVERESEQRARNGEGQVLRWRDYSQDGSNRDVCLTGESPAVLPAKHYLNGQPVEVHRGDEVTRVHGEVEADG